VNEKSAAKSCFVFPWESEVPAPLDRFDYWYLKKIISEVYSGSVTVCNLAKKCGKFLGQFGWYLGVCTL